MGDIDNHNFLSPRSVRRLDIDISELESSGRSQVGIHHWFTGSRPNTCFERHVHLADESQEDTSGEGVNLIAGTYYLEDADTFSESPWDRPLGPILISEYKDIYSHSAGPYIPCNGRLYRLIYDKIGFYCRGITTGGEGAKQVRDMRIQDLPYQPGGHLMSFCPASGRVTVCYRDSANMSLTIVFIYLICSDA